MQITTEAIEKAKATVSTCHALEAHLRPTFDAQMADLDLKGLKALAREALVSTRGCRVRADYLRKIEAAWRAEVWDAAGYRYGMRPRRFFIAA